MAEGNALYGKYIVIKPEDSTQREAIIAWLNKSYPEAYVGVSIDTSDIDSPFVLMPRKDPVAFAALLNYAQNCDNELSTDIVEFMARVSISYPSYGSQGLRNIAYAIREAFKTATEESEE